MELSLGAVRVYGALLLIILKCHLNTVCTIYFIFHS